MVVMAGQHAKDSSLSCMYFCSRATSLSSTHLHWLRSSLVSLEAFIRCAKD